MAMTNPERYRAREIEYDALSDDERNGIVAEMEGWKCADRKWTHVDDCRRFFKAPVFLERPEFWAPLIEKHGLRIDWMAGEPVNWMCTPDTLTQIQTGPTPQAAIVHAVCEIAREQHDAATE